MSLLVVTRWLSLGFFFGHLYAKDYHCDILSSRRQNIPGQVIRTMAAKLPSQVSRQVEQGISVLKNGGVVAFPTDTVYGLGADAGDEGVVERVYQLKGRPREMALPLLLADSSQIDDVASDVSPLAWASLSPRRPDPGAA